MVMDPRDPLLMAVFASMMTLLLMTVLLALWTGHVAWVGLTLPMVMADLSASVAYHRGRSLKKSQGERRWFIAGGGAMGLSLVAVDVWLTGLGPSDGIFWGPAMFLVVVFVADTVLTPRVEGGT